MSASVCALAACAITGCALELDYGPPTQGRDASHFDGGAIDAGRYDAAVTCDAGCDDGLRCTADNCVSGRCVHTTLCPTGTDCVARNGGECRRPCTSAADCNDGSPCTAAVCDPTDGHCAHPSTCPSAAPVCLDNGVCVPAHCATDPDCSDHDACNGIERCISGVCHGGTAVTCPASTQCRIIACDPASGSCVERVDLAPCNDGHACTIDTCDASGACVHTPDDTVCASPNHCVTRVCHPAMATDPSGCAVSSMITCPSSPCMSTRPALCDPTTGSCNFDALCPTGHVCGPTGCVAPNVCTGDAQCASIRSAAGCATFCRSAQCLPLACSPLPTGSCGVLSVDTNGCPSGSSCAYTASDALCADGDPLSVDRCNGPMLTCTHTCPTSTNSCVSYTYNGTMCVPQYDSMFCTNAHGVASRSNCAAWACVGAAAGGGQDGCAVSPSPAACSDGASCTDDVCTLAADHSGACSNPLAPTAAMICDDMIDCTHDVCDPMASTSQTGCTHTADDTVCTTAAPGLACAMAYCAPLPATARVGPLPTGCALRYDPAQCANGAICATDGHCAVVTCGPRIGCDDGNPCNGMEICNVMTNRCVQAPPPVVLCPMTPGCQSVCTPSGCVAPHVAACGAVI